MSNYEFQIVSGQRPDLVETLKKEGWKIESYMLQRSRRKASYLHAIKRHEKELKEEQED